MNNKKNILSLLVKNISLDVALGFLVLVIMTPITPFNSVENVIKYYQYWFIACCLMGVTNLIYEFENISILLSTALHFIATILIIAFTISKTETLINIQNIKLDNILFLGIIIATVIFVVCWIISYYQGKKSAEEINSKLRDKI